MRELNLKTKNKTYPIYIGADIISNIKLISPFLTSKQILIVTNETIAPLYLSVLNKALASFNPDNIILPDGEEYKTQKTVDLIYDKLIRLRYDRECILIALGGGVVGDITGYAASCYMRGVKFIQIPTTLLSQVDSSVGGKTGINHPKGKNMIGSFWQPECVICDINTLNTLNSREIKAGFAEIIKAAIIADKNFFNFLDNNIDEILSLDSKAIESIIYNSCRIKADIVSRDEREQGLRATLNLGHTFAHAIETKMGYGNVLHGEAVAIGIKKATEYSFLHGSLSQYDRDAILGILQKSRILLDIADKMKAVDYLNAMEIDKKTRNNQINLILIKEIANVYISYNVDKTTLHNFLDK
jgi:3-dehydroquinate synthase